LDRLKPEYNIVEIAGSTLGYKHSEESLKKMRDFVLSDEVLAKKKLATKNATIARSIPILVKNIKTNKTFEYVSLSAASNSIGVTKSAISQALLNNRIIKKTYVLKIKKKECNNSEDQK
jgi:acetoacetate decarboxylase